MSDNIDDTLLESFKRATHRVVVAAREAALRSQGTSQYLADPEFAQNVDRVLAVTDPARIQSLDN